MDRYPLRSKAEPPQDPVAMTTDAQTFSHTPETCQAPARPAVSIVCRRTDLEGEITIPPRSLASRPTLRIPTAAELRKLELRTDKTDTNITTETASRGPEGFDPALCLATPVAVWPAGPCLTPRGQGYFTTTIRAAEGGPASCGLYAFPQARDSLQPPGELVAEELTDTQTTTAHTPHTPDTTLAPDMDEQTAHPNWPEHNLLTVNVTSTCTLCNSCSLL